ncbi:DUF4124 domain-containing protein [Pseudoxanthomonas daejeonensis]|uniref:DUF4124 domain-containing protein n=1 Tax=Pseudoxanthomonas daejeonensis TaxID=266062 RepID=UPI00139131AA|nr:DUF4124 domain-containing protein [Pseudoxanthomonas daejeonensis]
MRGHATLLLLPLFAILPAPPAGAQQAATGGVTIYRCVDSRGQLVALRDSPCRDGERQETVQMQRPQDPPARAASTATPVAASAPVAPDREVRIITVAEPAPVYECTAPDGTTYTSASGEGQSRWVPLWTMGYPVGPGPRPRPPQPGLPPVRPAGPAPVAAGAGRPHGGGHRPSPGVIVPGGTWVRDSCVRLSREEVCGALSDRRYEILRVYHAGMPSERAALDREQREIDARMANECRTP